MAEGNVAGPVAPANPQEVFQTSSSHVGRSSQVFFGPLDVAPRVLVSSNEGVGLWPKNSPQKKLGAWQQQGELLKACSKRNTHAPMGPKRGSVAAPERGLCS